MSSPPQKPAKLSGPAKLSDCIHMVADTLSPRDLLALAETDAANRDALKPLLDAQWTTLCEDASTVWSMLQCIQESAPMLRKHLLDDFPEDVPFRHMTSHEKDAAWDTLPASFRDRVVRASYEPEVYGFDTFGVSYRLRAIGRIDVDVTQKFTFASARHSRTTVTLGDDEILVGPDIKKVMVYENGDARCHGLRALLHWAYHGSFDAEPQDPDAALWVRFVGRRVLENRPVFNKPTPTFLPF